MPHRLALSLSLLALTACQQAPAGRLAMPAAPVAAAPAAAKAVGRVTLTPSYVPGALRKLQAVVAPNTIATINHLEIKLYDTLSGSEVLAAQTDLVAADLADPVTFGGLKNDRTYRARATAYKAAGTAPADKISVDGGSFVDIVVGTDDRPALGNLVVTLTDVTFQGEATSTGVDFNAGSLVHSGSETVSVNP